MNIKENQNTKQIILKNSIAEFLILAKQSGGDNVDVCVQDGTIWLTQKAMGELFDITKENISIHLKNIFASKELEEDSVAKKYLATGLDGKNYNTLHYKLEAVIAVGYRVNSKKALEFRKWATSTLKDFILRGYVLDKDRMENDYIFDDDYFERVLEEIEEISLSKRRFWQKITDIYATAFDYDPHSTITRDLFAKIINKDQFLTQHQTAPELANLAQIVSKYLDIAKQRAIAKIPMDMDSWAKYIDIVIQECENDLLDNPGKIIKKLANIKYINVFEKYRFLQVKMVESDYERYMKEIGEIID
jgi:hypothetical protein